MLPIPAAVKVYPVLGLAACQAGQGHGYALWTLARAIDGGAGCIEQAALDEAMTALRWPTHQQRRARAQALAAGLVTVSAGRYWLASLLRVAQSYQLESVGAVPVWAPTAAMRRLSAWKTVLWSGLHASRPQGRPIARKTLELQTGVSPRTQQRLDHQAQITSTPTYKAATAHTMPPGYSAILREQTGGHRCFEKDGRAWMQGSSIYTSNLDSAKRGRCRKVNRQLRPVLVFVPAGQRARQRSYFDRQDAATRASRLPDLPGRPVALQPVNVKKYWCFATLAGGAVLFLPVA